MKRFKCQFNTIDCAASATTMGVLAFQTAAATQIAVEYNTIIHRLANSTIAVLGMAGITGSIAYNRIGIMNATGGATAIATVGNAHLTENYGTVPAKTGILIGTVSG